MVSEEASMPIHASNHRRTYFIISLKITAPESMKYNIIITKNLNYKTNKLTSIVLICYNSCLLSKNHVPTNDISCWGPELERMRWKISHLIISAKNTSTKTDWATYKNAQKSFKQKIHEGKTKAWCNICKIIKTK